MKKIIKKEPKFFKDFIKRTRPEKWSEVSHAIGYDIRTYMLYGQETNKENRKTNNSEQNFQCAYTEINIEPESNISHIDHFRKQEFFPELKFDWTNLFTCYNYNYYGAKYKDNKSGIEKEDYRFLINPAIEDPDDYFKYSYTGEILIKSKDTKSIKYKKAKKTIDVFNLNDKSLIERRLTVAKQLRNYYKELSLTEIKKNIGRFDSFIEHLYKDLKKPAI